MNKGTYTTPKGSVLYLMEIKGKPYLQVQERIIWFREEHPKGRIKTHLVRSSDAESVFYAEIQDESGNLLASAHKHETKSGFTDHLEKSETGAIGRALALCGFGTQFTALEFSEGQRLADAPSSRGLEVDPIQGTAVDDVPWPEPGEAPHEAPAPNSPPHLPFTKPAGHSPLRVPLDVAKRFKPAFGKYRGQALGTIDALLLKSYVTFLKKDGKELSAGAKDFVLNAQSIIDSHAQPNNDEIPF